MSFTIISPAGAYPTGGYSLPDLVSFCVVDDGSGGSVYINGRGVVDPTVAGAVDLKTLFTAAGMLFNSTPLLRAFRVITPSPTNQATLDQLVKNLEVSIYLVALNGSTVYPGEPVVLPLVGLSGGPANVPYLALRRELTGGEGGGSAGLWRVELKLRHSLTN